MLDQIKEIHDEIIALLVRMKKPILGMNRLISNLEKKSKEEVERLFNFFDSLYKNEFKRLKDVWTLPHINDDMWHGYRMLRIRDLPEQKSLHDAWEAYHDRVAAFKKERKSESQHQTDSQRIRKQSLRRRRTEAKASRRSR